MKTKVLTTLKPKALSLGFNPIELDGVAATIAANLTAESTDDEIEAAVNAVIPYLQVSQSVSNRIINAEKAESTKALAKIEADKEAARILAGGAPPKTTEEKPQWAIDLEKRLEAISTGNVSKDRKATFEATLTGLMPKQKESMLKDFDRINFTDDADFQTYLTEKSATILGINQELADEGLSKMARPAGGGGEKQDKPSVEVQNRITERNAEQGATAISGLPK
jgi:hypothetical protein